MTSLLPSGSRPNRPGRWLLNGLLAALLLLGGAASAWAADVATTLAGPTSAPAGSLVTYTATLLNTNAPSATGTALRVQLPANFPSANVSQSDFGTYNQATGVATFPTATPLANGVSYTRIVRIVMPASGTFTATASSTSTSADANAANNNGTAANATVTTTATQLADLAVAVSGPVAATPGASLVYTVQLTNLGPSVATGISPQLVLTGSPTAITPSSGTVAGGTVTFGTGLSLAAGATLAYTVRFTVPATLGTPVTGTASASLATPDPNAGNNDGTAPPANVSTAVVSSTPSGQCAAPGLTDSLNYTGTQGVNTYYPGTANAAAGQNTVTVGTAVTTGTAPVSGVLAVGDLVLIIQMQGADLNTNNTDGSYGDGFVGDPGFGALGTNFTAGQYEYGLVATTGAGTFTLVSNLTYAYQNAAATTTAGQRRFQVVRVPQYQNFTLDPTLTAPLTAPTWNGSTGGVLVLDVAGTLTLNGKTIDMKGKGFRGGAGRAARWVA